MSQNPLDYQSPGKKKRRKPSVAYSRGMAGAVIGVVVTVPAVYFSWAAAFGSFHGDGGNGYPMVILFPVSCMLGMMSYGNPGLLILAIAFAFIQFPGAGLTVGWYSAVSRKACAMSIGAIVAIHVLAVLAFFALWPKVLT